MLLLYSTSNGWTAEALANIVDNAIKYTEHGNTRFPPCCREMFARIDISDNVQAYRKLSKLKIFVAFYRSKAVQEQEGVGIGLYLARQIISARAVIISRLPFREKEVFFPYFC